MATTTVNQPIAAANNGTSSSPKLTGLDVISYERLSGGDVDEVQRLVHAATSRGIFFLETNTSAAATDVTSKLPRILDAEREFFRRPLEEKKKFESKVPERGYHKSIVPDVETLLVSREDELNGTLTLPKELLQVSDKLRPVTDFTDSVLRDMYRILCESITPKVSTIASENPSEPNYTNLTLGYSNEEAGAHLIPEHADSGLITLLYYDLPSLEILEPDTGEWELVQPRPGHQVVYIGKHFSNASEG